MTADFMKSEKKEIFEIQKQLSVKQLCIKSYIHNLKKWKNSTAQKKNLKFH